jgi:hypothetical protein
MRLDQAPREDSIDDFLSHDTRFSSSSKEALIMCIDLTKLIQAPAKLQYKFKTIQIIRSFAHPQNASLLTRFHSRSKWQTALRTSLDLGAGNAHIFLPRSLVHRFRIDPQEHAGLLGQGFRASEGEGELMVGQHIFLLPKTALTTSTK